MKALSLTSLQKRILSGMVLAPATIGVILSGGWVFMVLMMLALLISVWEWFGLAAAGRHKYFHMLFGVVYLCACYAAYIFIRFGFDEGAWLALTVMLCVWSSDIGAYLAGKKIGGPKMAPALSPNKTWAGFGGSVISCGLALVILLFLGHELKPWLDTDIGLMPEHFWAVFLAGGLLGAVGQAGDLFISFYKRRVGAKDSGALIPGHGGLLDRIDALLLVTPVFLAVLMLWRIS